MSSKQRTVITATIRIKDRAPLQHRHVCVYDFLVLITFQPKKNTEKLKSTIKIKKNTANITEVLRATTFLGDNNNNKFSFQSFPKYYMN